MICKCGLKLRYGGVVDGRSVYFHKSDGKQCEPSQDKTFARVERMLPRWRKKLLKSQKNPPAQMSFGWN